MDKCHHSRQKIRQERRGERREKYITLARRPACKGPRRSRGVLTDVGSLLGVRSSIVLSSFGSKGEPGRGGEGREGVQRAKEQKRQRNEISLWIRLLMSCVSCTVCPSIVGFQASRATT